MSCIQDMKDFNKIDSLCYNHSSNENGMYLILNQFLLFSSCCEQLFSNQVSSDTTWKSLLTLLGLVLKKHNLTYSKSKKDSNRKINRFVFPIRIIFPHHSLTTKLQPYLKTCESQRNTLALFFFVFLSSKIIFRFPV
jgi:hypothetical protein